MKPADFWNKKNDLSIQCELCPHKCIIFNGQKGICGVRENNNQTLFTLNYFVASSRGIDPIEKKPLYHFYPGSSILSLGTFGCNLSCNFCQNHSISKGFSVSHLNNPNFSKKEILIFLKIILNKITCSLLADWLTLTMNQQSGRKQFSS